MNHSSTKELIVIIPDDGGDPGEPLTQEVKDLIHALETLGYAPTGFGDKYTPTSGDMTLGMELWFEEVVDKGVRMELATRFIQLNGDI